MADQPPKSFTYAYPRPAVTVDVAIVTTEETPRLLLIRRKHDPFAGRWALPGGFVDENEPLHTAAQRELREETGVEHGTLEQVQTFGNPGRDPRGWTISVAYLARVDVQTIQPIAGDDAADVAWYPFDTLPPLAFDHAEIIEHVRQRL